MKVIMARQLAFFTIAELFGFWQHMSLWSCCQRGRTSNGSTLRRGSTISTDEIWDLEEFDQSVKCKK